MVNVNYKESLRGTEQPIREKTSSNVQPFAPKEYVGQHAAPNPASYGASEIPRFSDYVLPLRGMPPQHMFGQQRGGVDVNLSSSGRMDAWTTINPYAVEGGLNYSPLYPMNQSLPFLNFPPPAVPLGPKEPFLQNMNFPPPPLPRFLQGPPPPLSRGQEAQEPETHSSKTHLQRDVVQNSANKYPYSREHPSEQNYRKTRGDVSEDVRSMDALNRDLALSRRDANPSKYSSSRTTEPHGHMKYELLKTARNTQFNNYIQPCSSENSDQKDDCDKVRTSQYSESENYAFKVPIKPAMNEGNTEDIRLANPYESGAGAMCETGWTYYQEVMSAMYGLKVHNTTYVRCAPEPYAARRDVRARVQWAGFARAAQLYGARLAGAAVRLDVTIVCAKGSAVCCNSEVLAACSAYFFERLVGRAEEYLTLYVNVPCRIMKHFLLMMSTGECFVPLADLSEVVSKSPMYLNIGI